MFIVYAIIGIALLVLGLFLYKKFQKKGWKILIYVGILSLLVSIILFVCTILLVTAQDSEDEVAIGGDWRTWRAYTSSYVLSENLSVCFSAQEEDGFYAMYDDSSGTRIGTLFLGEYLVKDTTGGFIFQDYDGDEINDIGVPLNNGQILTFSYNSDNDMWDEIVIKDFDENSNKENSIEYPYTSYAYESGELNDEQLRLYNELYPKIMARELFSYKTEDVGYEVLDNILVAWDALSTDFPQIDNYFTIDEIDDSEGNVLSFDSCYTCIWTDDRNQDTEELITQGILEFEDICNQIIKNIPKESTTYEKYYYLAAALSNRVEYDYLLDLPGNYTPYCIVTGSGICQGYAKAYQYLCQKANLWCRMVSGASENVAHAWNIVKLDSGIFHIDVTWADEQGEPGSEEWLRYFMLTEDQILIDHEIQYDIGYIK